MRLSHHVSILARPEGRALQIATHREVPSTKFQSSLGPRAERYRQYGTLWYVWRLFQSSLGPRAERYLLSLPRRLKINQFQSSLGPRAERYPPKPRRHFPSVLGFNPRSARGPSATWCTPTNLRNVAMFQSSLGPRAERYCLVPNPFFYHKL